MLLLMIERNSGARHKFHFVDAMPRSLESSVEKTLVMYAGRGPMDWIVFLLLVLGLLAVLATILPLWRTTRWWVRICPLLRPPQSLLDWLFLSSLLGVVISIYARRAGSKENRKSL